MSNERRHEDTDRGYNGEQWVKQQYDLERCPDTRWCDLQNPRTGARHEVKVALPNRRFRVWKDNHRSLVSSNAAGTAWYDFLVMSRSGRITDHRRMQPTTVSRIVDELGGWNESGHARGSYQKKIPVAAIF